MHLAALLGDLGLTASVWHGFAHAAGPILVTSIWQGAVIVCGLEICLRLMLRISAAQRFAIWAAGFGVVAGLPLLALMHLGSAEGAGVWSSGVSVESAAPMLQLDARWGLAIAGLWIAASLMRGASLAVHSMRLRRVWKAAQPMEICHNLTAALENVRGGRVTVCTTEMLDRPSVIGFLAPRILIPEWLMGRLSASELEQIVLHEAEHLRRGDDWTNLAQKLWLVAFPLNPALAWIEHRLCQQREMACDEGVVRITNAPRAYAACLASLAERGLDRRAEALSLGAWHRRSELVARVHRILIRKRGLNRAAAAALLGAMGCALVAGSIEMARAPQLVAFVPKQASVMMSPERQQQLTAMLARENADAKLNLPAGFHAVQAKAALPDTDRPRATARRQARKCAATAKKTGQIAAADSSQIAKAEAIGDRVNSGNEQQWVVLAAWEEVRTVSSTAVSDFDASPMTTEVAADRGAQTLQKDSKPGDKATKGLPYQTSNYTVTQLILRVVPANSKSTQPATGFVRGGWFVFQL